MAIIYSYPRATVESQDYLIGTKFNSSGNPTKSFLVSDIVALINDYAGNVPYTGATADVDLGTHSIYTDGGARLYDDGTVEGVTFQFNANGSYLSDASTVARNWILPDANGTIALKTSASGSFTSNDGKTITVVNGIITSIV